MRLALRIARGGLRLLWRYPKLALPLLPIYVLALAALLSLLYIQSLPLALLVVFAVAYALMFSFAITSHMLHQIEEGGQPSLLKAVTSPATVRMIPRVFALSTLWYLLVTILVIVETAIRTLLGRISDDLADAVLGFIFGTVADALRMAGFMLVAIMTFEDVGLRPATGRLRAIASDSPVTILGGLALTKFVSLLSVLAVMFAPESLGLLIFIPLAALWILGMYLEQIFVTGLYLYSAAPESRLVAILLEDFVGKELPQLPPAAGEQALA
jgi:hypothetical protein